jgi:hypothetical protein
MDDRRFDALVRHLGRGGSRRTLLRTLIGIGGVAATGAVLNDTDAARRGYSGPPTLAPLSTRTPQPTTTPTQTPPSTATPTNTPDPCGPSGVCCAGDDDCHVIPTYCESTLQYPLLWRYHLCSGSGTQGVCTLTAHVCDNATRNCEIDVCDDQTGCALADVSPGQIGSSGAVCCSEDNHCGGLPRFCDGDNWHYYVCYAERCEERQTQCSPGKCSEPLGCLVIGS